MSFAVHTSDEKETFKSIAKAVLCRLGKVVLDLHQFSSVEEPEYKPAASSIVRSQTHNLSTQWLRLGKKGVTWHGYPDARVRIYNTDVPVLAHELGNKSPGDSIVVEAKVMEKSLNLVQLVATTVLAAFVEKNVHDELPPIIPTILITPESAKVCIYDVENDYLLISEWFTWTERVGDVHAFNKTGMLLFWMILNHR